MVLQHSTKFTTTITFLQKDCFFYNVEILNIIYIIVYQYNRSTVELVESVDAGMCPSKTTDLLANPSLITYFCIN